MAATRRLQTGRSAQFVDPIGTATRAFASVSGNTTLGEDHDIVVVTATATISLPTAVGIPGRVYLIKSNADGITVTIDPSCAETIDGEATVELAQRYQAVEIVSDDANWLIISRV